MLYRLDPHLQSAGRVKIFDNEQLIIRYIIWDIEKEAFKKIGRVRFHADKHLNSEFIQNTDFLNASLNLFVISPECYHAIHVKLEEDIEFHLCEVLCEEKSLDFYLGKIITGRPIVDTEKSTYRSMANGTQTLFGTVYRDDLEEDFFLARDIGNQYRYAASDKFIQLIQEYELKITATPHPTSSEGLLLK